MHQGIGLDIPPFWGHLLIFALAHSEKIGTLRPHAFGVNYLAGCAACSHPQLILGVARGVSFLFRTPAGVPLSLVFTVIRTP